MKKSFLFILHYALILTFFIVCLVLLLLNGIKDETLFIAFCSLFCIAHPFIYLILGTFKEYKYHNYKMPKYMLIAVVTTCIVGVLDLYIYFKLENNYFDKYWWIYEGVLVFGIVLPMLIGYLVNKYMPKKQTNGPKFIVNK